MVMPVFTERTVRIQYQSWANAKYLISGYHEDPCFVNPNIISALSDLYNPCRLHILHFFILAIFIFSFKLQGG